MAETNLKIVAYNSPGGGKTTNQIGDFTVLFNPNTFTINNTIEYKKIKAKGQHGGDPQFEKIPPLEFTVEFTIDGTGVAGGAAGKNKGTYVKDQLKKLRTTTGSNINGEIHRPNYLAVLWGTFYFECVLTSLSTVYNLFDRDGSPLRAKVSCTFLERIGPGKGGRKSRLESPDLTKYVAFKEGDLLPLIANDKYDDPAYYLQVAKANKLKSFMKILPGTKIVLPPMKN